MTFDGVTYEKAHDFARLSSQLERVQALMIDGQWRTLEEISTKVGGTIPSLSARLRDLRKNKFGGFTILRRRRDELKRGLHEYKMEAGK